MGQSGFARKVLRRCGALALFVLIHLVWSPVGTVSPAQAQVLCFAGETTAGARNCVVNFTTGVILSNPSLATTALPNTFAMSIASVAANLTVAAVFDDGGGDVTLGCSMSMSNYTGTTIAGSFCNFLDDIPDNFDTVPGATSTLVITATILGTVYSFTVEGIRKDDNVDSVTFGAITIRGGIFGGLGATGPTAGDRSSITASLQNSFNSVTPGLLNGALPLNGTGAGNGSGLAFSPTGLGFAQSRIDSANPLDRDYGAAFAPQGYFAQRDTRQRNNGFNFSVDLQGLAAAANKKDALAYGDGGAKDGAYRPRSRFNSWVTGKYVDFDDDETNADRDGSVWVVTSGLSVQMGANTNVGVISRYRQGDVDSTALSASLDIEAYGGGAYLTTTLGGGLNVALAALYEMGDNDIVISGARGDFDSEQFTVEGKIDKRLQRGAMWIQPAISLLYTDTQQDNYTDSAGTLVAGQDLTLGRLAYGPTIGTTISRGNTQIRPFAKINGIWDFENEGSFTTTTAGTFVTGDNALNLGGGVEIVYVSGFAIKIEGDWFSFDSDLEAWSISGGIGAPLSAFGIGSAGTLSLDLTSNAQDASATARVRIPIGKTD